MVQCEEAGGVLRLTVANTLSHVLMKRVLEFLYTGAVSVVCILRSR